MIVFNSLKILKSSNKFKLTNSGFKIILKNLRAFKNIKFSINQKLIPVPERALSHILPKKNQFQQ